MTSKPMLSEQPKNKLNHALVRAYQNLGGVQPMQKYSVKRAVNKVLALGTGAALMATSITGALALNLAEYPAPFVMNGKYDDSNAFVIGANAASSDTFGAIDIASGLQYESKVCSGTGSGSVSVDDGQVEDVPLGVTIASTSTSDVLDMSMDDGDISTLLDSEINFDGSSYDVAEVFQFGQVSGAPTLHTSLTAGVDEYETGVYMHIPRDSLKYYYTFDEAIQPNTTTTTDSLKIQFLGQTLDVTDINSNTQFTAYVGGQFFMNVGDSVEVDGKTVTLENVGSGGQVVISVDGVQETIDSDGTETVNGVEIANDETFYEDNKDQRSATLVIGKQASESYNDGDEFIGEPDKNPDWVWNVDGLNGNAATTTSDSAEYSGPYFGIENDFQIDDDKDDPPTVGDCIDLPNNYISVCFDSLTVADDNYMTLDLVDEDNADLSDVFPYFNSVGAVHLEAGEDNGLVIDTSNLAVTNGTTADLETEDIYLHQVPNVTGLIGVYYVNDDNDVRLAGYMANATRTQVQFAHVDFDNTKGTDMQITANLAADYNNLSVVIDPYDGTDLTAHNDNITAVFTLSYAASSNSTAVKLGGSASQEETGELVWTTTPIGTEEQDMRTRYGIIISNPDSNGNNDEVNLNIPGDIVLANIVVKGRAATVSSGSTGSNCDVAKINPVTLTDEDVASPEDYNLIVVGGPCANMLVEQMGFGLTCEGFRDTYSEGESVIKLASNGDKVAMLVAGYSALDTQRAAKVLANYNDYKTELTGTEVVVRGTSLSDITVTGGSE